MAGAAGAGPAEGFATLLRELKDRSGLSYGTLAKRLHMSASTLHRYCNGTAVPNDYAPVERLARVCKATPQELVELHRRWVLADAARAAASQVRREGGEGRAGEVLAAREPEAAEAGEAAGAPGADVQDAPDVPDEPVVVSVPGGSAAPRRRRTALVASAAAAVLVAAVLAVHPPWAGDDDGSANGNLSDAADRKAGGASASQDTPTPDTSTAPTRSAGAGTAGDRQAVGASATPSSPAPDTSAAPTAGSATVPITVRTRPYVYDNPCSQHFLVDNAPAQMGPPANEENAPRWAASYGAVSSDEQRVALTVQGAGSRTVVLEALHVTIESRNAPLAWNDYAMGVGCGGGVETKSFDVDLDSGSPTVTVKNGQRAFPYSVSESDPEVFYVTAHTKAHDVRWDLTLDWSSGSRHGTVRVDNDGTPFRTSADVNRPGYDYPLGGSDWIPRTS
ncbi:helix-turn-helix domain-containing protein [Streptomyces sp. NPDC102270]|uniref:transcriptional regulator n=1 Tax=Streptomyces sp. NPDC102270 TaxID=3366150 RepID=UPI00380B02C3